MRYRELVEAKMKTVYHGDNHGTSSINPALMSNGNNQEGIGIYFADDINTARDYGEQIVSAHIDVSRFIPSRESIGEFVAVEQMQNILKALWKFDEESMFYWVSDWIMVTEPEDISEYHIEELAGHIMTEEVRNLQVDLAEKFGVENMVQAWNRYTNIDGTFHRNRDDDMWYAIINPSIKLSKG